MNWTRILLGVVAGLGLVVRASAQVVYSDSNFHDVDWTILDVTINSGSSESVYEPSSGNPDAYRRITTHVANAPAGQRSAVESVHLLNGAVYDPAVDGPVTSVIHREDARTFSSFGLGQRRGPAIRQDGVIYCAFGLTTGTNSTWHVLEATYSELDFLALDTSDLVDMRDETTHPDFSAVGSPIEIGFYSGNSTAIGDEGYTIIGGIDNWSLTIVPEPGSAMVMMATAACAAICGRRRAR